MVPRAWTSSARYACGSCWASWSSHDHVPMTISGWYWPMIRGRSAAQVWSVLSPHPPKALSATTSTSPVASRAAPTPGALSAMTLSPMIQARSGSAAETTRPGGSTMAGAGVAVDADADAGAGRVAGARATLPVEASTGGTVAIRTAPITPTNPAGTRARRHHRPKSARRRGRSTAK